ncbi:hypothetical protein FKM82_011149 [Ascaphus truei]
MARSSPLLPDPQSPPLNLCSFTHNLLHSSPRAQWPRPPTPKNVYCRSRCSDLHAPPASKAAVCSGALALDKEAKCSSDSRKILSY